MELHEKLPNFKSDLPTYFPVHLSLRVNTEFSGSQLLNQIDDRLISARKTSEMYLNYLIENTHLLEDPSCEQFLTTQLETCESLSLTKHKLQTLQSALKTAHKEFVDSRKFEEDLSLSNYHVYKDVTKTNFADKIVQDLDKLEDSDQAYKDILKADTSFQYLKNALFVLQNPEDPLPDEQKDDDVAIAGGKISLKDPLSLNFFVEPVLLAKCNHVYERKYITRQMQDGVPINCPVTGCSATIKSGDLRDDKLMALRVKAYLAKKSRTEKSSVVRI